MKHLVTSLPTGLVRLLTRVRGTIGSSTLPFNRNIIGLMFFLMSNFFCVFAYGQGSVTLSFSHDNCINTKQAGTYSVSGTYNGKPYYVKGSGSKILWSGSKWELHSKDWQGNFHRTHYNNSNTSRLPCNEWKADYGCFLPSVSGDCVSPPTSSTIPGVSVDEGAEDKVINLRSYFNDEQDGSAGLTYSKQSVDGSFFTASINGSDQLTINFDESGTGISTVTIRATDTDGDHVEESFTVKATTPIPGSVIIDFEDQGFSNGANFGSGVYTEDNIRITYNDGYYFTENVGGGESGTAGLHAEAWSFMTESITIETIDGTEMDFISFHVSSGPVGAIQGYKNGASTGSHSGELSGSISLGSAFDAVDKIVITSGEWGFFDTFDSFLFLPLGPSNTPPNTANVSFSGSLEVGEVLTGSYDFSDEDGDSEDGSIYKWYRSDDGSGSNKTEIDEATSLTYTLDEADEGKYISFEVTPRDGTDSGEPVESDLQLCPDVTAPVILNVSSSNSEGSYKVGDVISIIVTADEELVVNESGGTPEVKLETGDADRVATYSEGSGTTALTFQYTIQDGDNSLDLDYLNTGALVTGGGTIRDVAGNDAVLTLPSPGTTHSLGANSDILVDGGIPTGYQVTLDQDPITTDNDHSVGFTFSGAETGTAYNYTFSSDGGGTAVTGSGTVTGAGQQVSGIDISGLELGTITISVTLTDEAGNIGPEVSDEVEKLEITGINVDDPTKSESGTLSFKVSLTQPAPGAITVDFTTVDGTAEAGKDYTSANGTISFSEGESFKTIDVLIEEDDVLEGDETIKLKLSNVTGSDVMILDGEGIGTITNDDHAAVNIEDVSGNEDEGNITLTATLDHAVQGGFTVDVKSVDGTAEAGDADFTQIANHTLTFSGEAGETQTFLLTSTADTKLESDEQLSVEMGNLGNTDLDIDVSDNATVTLKNDDEAAVTISDVSGKEDDGAITVSAILDHDVQGGFTLDVSTQDQTAEVSDDDYTSIVNHTLTFTGNEGEEQTFLIHPTSDSKLEADETISLSMANLGSTTLAVAIDDQASLTIKNDDEAAISISDASGKEDDGTITVTATLDNAVQGGFSISVSSVNGTAEAGKDFQEIDRHVLDFNGSQGENHTFNLLPTTDAILESDESLSLFISALEGTLLEIDTTDTGIVTIENDDNAAVTIADISKNENDGDITVKAMLDHAVQGGFTVDVATIDGTAQSGEDFTSISEHTLAFEGTEDEVQTFILSPITDTKLEGDEQLVVTMSNLQHTSLNVNVSDDATITLLNDDQASVTLSDVSGLEDEGSMLMEAKLDHAVQGGFTVEVNTEDGTAKISDGDYTAVEGHVLTFSGTENESQTFTLNVTKDSKLEVDETVNIAFANLGNTSLSVDISDVAVATIGNDDEASVTLAAASGAEDDGAITITATLDHPVQGGFTLEASTQDSTALASEDDYKKVVSHDLVFAGTTNETKSFTVIPITDGKVESDEILKIVMANLSTSLPVDISSRAIVRIENDDEAKIGIKAITDAKESGSQGILRLTSDYPIDTSVLIGIEVTGNADEGVDFEDPGKEVVFPANELTFDVVIDVISDELVERDESVTIALKSINVANIEIGGDDIATILIEDDDQSYLSLTTQGDVNEGDESGSFELHLSNAFDTIVHVTYELDGTATEKSDYEAITRVVTFPAFSTKQNVEVTLLQDLIDEVNETLSMTVASVDHKDLIIKSGSDSSMFYILDDDHTPVISGGQEFHIDEDAVSGTSIGHVIATDEDDDTNLQDWHLVSGNDLGAFRLDKTSGELTVLENAAIDFDDQSEFSLQVSVSDGVNISDTVAILIVIGDATAPSVVLTSDMPEVSNVQTFKVTASFDEKVNELEPTDIEVKNGLVSNLITDDHMSWTFDVTASGEGSVTISLPGEVVTDNAGNGNSSSNVVGYYHDVTRPQISLSKSVEDLTNIVESILVVDVSEPVTGLEEVDLILENASLSSFSGSEAYYQITVQGQEGIVSIEVPEGVAFDQAGNGNEATLLSWKLDVTPPDSYGVEILADAVSTLNQRNISFNISDVEPGSSFTYEFVSSSGDVIAGTGNTDGEGHVVRGVNLTSFPAGLITLTVRVTDAAGNEGPPVSSTIRKEVVNDIPQGFSPNGDGINDQWIIPGIEEFPSNRVTIYNRYGKMVWETVNYDNLDNAWDSRSNMDNVFGDSGLPDGAYFYVINFPEGDMDPRSGYIIINR